MEFGTNLKKVLEEMGVTQRELANRMGKEENVFAEALQSMGYLFRHRGSIRIPDLPGIKGRTIDTIKIGKKVIHLDNAIPALIQDTFYNLGYERKDGTKPVIAAKRKTEHGWHLVIQLPPGISFRKVKEDINCFQDAVNAWINLEWKHGKCHMNIQVGELPDFMSSRRTPVTSAVG